MKSIKNKLVELKPLFNILTRNKGLSNREAEVAILVTRGLSNKEIANQLFVTERTIKFHLPNIYKKMDVKSRAQLIIWCLPYMGFGDCDDCDDNREELVLDEVQKTWRPM